MMHGSHVDVQVAPVEPAGEREVRVSDHHDRLELGVPSPFRSSFGRDADGRGDADLVASRTTTHPTGTFHRFSAPSASTSAARIHRSSASSNARVARLDGPRVMIDTTKTTKFPIKTTLFPRGAAGS